RQTATGHVLTLHRRLEILEAGSNFWIAKYSSFHSFFHAAGLSPGMIGKQDGTGQRYGVESFTYVQKKISPGSSQFVVVRTPPKPRERGFRHLGGQTLGANLATEHMDTLRTGLVTRSLLKTMNGKMENRQNTGCMYRVPA